MRFIALDPGSRFTGWAVFDGDGLVAWGRIVADKVEYSSRFQFIVNELGKLLDQFNFEEVAVEEAVRFEGREIPALKVASLGIKKWAEGRRLPYSKYNVATWKASVVGNGHAGKEATARNILLRYPSLPADLSEHEYDAIAIGVYHAGILNLQARAVAVVVAGFARCVKCGQPVEGSEGKKGFSLCQRCAGEAVDKATPADLMALAKTGIDALIDEATNFEDVRPKDDLANRFRNYRRKASK